MIVFAPIVASVHCLVGCAPGSSDRQALHVLECDAETGRARLVQSVKGVQGTTYFQLDADGRFLYSMLGETRGGKSAGALVRFAMDGGRIGEMKRVCEIPCEAPCHVALTPDGRRIGFAAYGSATVGAVGVDGSGLKTFALPDDEMGTNGIRQTKAYAHQVFFVRPGGGRPARMGVVDLGCDRIWFFDPETMERDTSLTIRTDAGDGPRHAVWSKDGKTLFVLCELGSCVCSFAFDGRVFSRRQKISTIPREGLDAFPVLPGETSFTKAAAIKLTDDGRILMASNRGHDSIAFYEVRPDGLLRLRNIARLKGPFPRDFELMPGEKFMVVGHKMADEVQVYRFGREACTLTPVGAPIPCWRPLCFKFAK